MSFSASRYYKTTEFPTGSIANAYSKLIKGQKGNGWSREITITHNTHDGIHSERLLSLKDLSTIVTLNDTNDELRINSKNQLITSERVLLAYAGWTEGSRIYISSNSAQRCIEIADIFEKELDLEKNEKPSFSSSSLEPQGKKVKSEQQILIIDSPTTLLTLPPQITIDWLKKHMPIKWILSLISLGIMIFSAGVAVGRLSKSVLPPKEELPSATLRTEKSYPHQPNPLTSQKSK